MRYNILAIIAGMFMVTYIPRYLPFFISQNLSFPRRIKSFLSYIPVAALGALILPDAFFSMGDKPLASTLGIIFAGIFSYFYKNIFITVVGAISVTYLVASCLGG